MSLHINRFIDKLKAADSRRQREFTMSITEAHDLHADITKLLLAIQHLQEGTEGANSEVIQVEVTGGSF